MYCANAVCCPSGRPSAKHRATAADFPTIEQGFLAFDRVDNFEKADVLWLSRKRVAAPRAFGRTNDARFLELWKNLGDKRGRDALKLSEFAAAQWYAI